MSLPSINNRSSSDSEEVVDHLTGVSTRSARRASPLTAGRSWQTLLGLHPRVSKLAVVALVVHASSSILFLVFLNSIQPFYIAQLQSRTSPSSDRPDDEAPSLRIGLLTGKLAFSDELISIFLVLLWGTLSDRLGISVVAAIGYCLISLGLVSYAVAQKPWPDLLWARLIFAGGASAVTAMLTASLAAFSHRSTHIEISPAAGEGQVAGDNALEVPSQEASETTPLVGSNSRTAHKTRHGRLASLAGILTGLGAILAVFVLLPLPIWLASLHEQGGTGGPEDPAVQKGTREAFLLVACIALCSASVVAIGLREPGRTEKKRREAHRRRGGREATLRQGANEEQEEPAVTAEIDQLPRRLSARQARRERLRDRLQARGGSTSIPSAILRGVANASRAIFELSTRSLDGFRLGWQDKTGRVALAYLGGALARGVTIGSTVFLPLLISHYFYIINPDLCSPPSTPSVPPSELKRLCRQAYILTSAQSGVLQSIALLFAPLVGLASDSCGAPPVLGISAFLGMAAGLVYGIGLPGEGDPRVPRAWIAACLLGITQISSIITSLSLIASLTSSSPSTSTSSSSSSSSSSSTSRKEERSPGSLAGAYSSTGALSILLLTSIGGWLFDLMPSAPFLLLAGYAAIVGFVAVVVCIADSVRRRRSS